MIDDLKIKEKEPPLPKRLIKHLYKKKELLEEGDSRHKDIKTALVILGGGMRGVSGGAITLTLHYLGLSNVFDYVLGSSAGASAGAYFLSGKESNQKGLTIFYQDLPDNFINYFRRPIMDLNYVEKLIKFGPKKINIKKIKEHRSKFYVLVTNAQSGEGELIDAKRAKPSLYSAIKASSAFPGFFSHPVEANRKSYYDGGIADPLPLMPFLRKEKITDLLVIANRPYGLQIHGLSFFERYLAPILKEQTSEKIRRLALSRHSRLKNFLQEIKNLETMGSGVIWSPDNGVYALTTDSKKLEEQAILSSQKTFKLFRRKPKDIIIPRLEKVD